MKRRRPLGADPYWHHRSAESKAELARLRLAVLVEREDDTSCKMNFERAVDVIRALERGFEQASEASAAERGRVTQKLELLKRKTDRVLERLLSKCIREE